MQAYRIKKLKKTDSLALNRFGKRIVGEND